MTSATPSRTLVAEPSDDGERLDRFVQERCPDLSRSRGASLIRDGFVTINGVAAKPSAKVHAGNAIVVNVPDPTPSNLVPQDIPVGVVYQDPNLLVIDKPAGLTVHPAPGHPDGTLVNALLAMMPDLSGIGGELRPGIVHRLDKDTSGLMAVAKNDATHRSLARQLKDRVVQKAYVALVAGRVRRDDGTIDAPIARHPKHRQRMAIVDGGRDAVTEFRVLKRYGPSTALPSPSLGANGYTLVEAHPVTGRTHQIRVHFASIGHPLVGDPVYGKRSPLVARHFLHAARLAFLQPPDEQGWVEFESPLPPDLQAALDALNQASLKRFRT